MYKLLVNYSFKNIHKVVQLFLIIVTNIAFAQTIKVIRVIDGDTFETETGEKVRLIGINAPEISDIYGQEAKDYLSELVENKTIYLESDNLSQDRDRYQRLLRYAFLGNVDINKKMLSEGFAFAYLKFRFNKSAEYAKAQIEARELNKGIWGSHKKEKTIEIQEEHEKSYFRKLSPKFYFISILVLFLLFIMIYTYKSN